MLKVRLGDIGREYKGMVKDMESLPSVRLEHLEPGEILEMDGGALYA